MAGTKGIDRALDLLRLLPRVGTTNLRDPAKKISGKRGRGQKHGFQHGAGSKGSKQRQNFMRVGYETGTNPFYLRVPQEKYYQGHHLRREYLPITLWDLQLMIDLGRINPDEMIDVTSFCNTYLYSLNPRTRQFGFQLQLDGVDSFKAKLNIEVQWTTESVIAAVEKNGGIITTAYYDIEALEAAVNPVKFFRRGIPIPRRLMPPQDLVEYYTDPKTRGYLADPEKIAEERFKLSQKYGYKLPDIATDPQKTMLLTRKDPRQLFLGLQPGWLVNLRDKLILKPKDPELKEFYQS